MANYSNKDIFLQRRTSTGTFEEHPLVIQPNSVVITDTAGNLVMVNTASFISGTGSIEFAVSSSFSTTSSYAINVPATASYSLMAESASYLIEGANIYLSQSNIYANTNSVAPPHLEGQMWWDGINHTYAIDTFQSRLQIGQENYTRVFAGEIIPDGSPVYLDGAEIDPHDPNSKLPIAWLAIADGTGLKSHVVGLSTQDLVAGEEGLITTQGIVNEIDTQTPDFNDGDIVYLSTTQSGSLVNTIPIHPYEIVSVGVVLYRHPTIGRILVQLHQNNRQYVFAGVTCVPTFSNTGSITGSIVNVSSCSVHLNETSDGTGLIKHFSVPSASFIISSNFLDVQYLVVNYNSGSPVYDVITDLSGIDDIQIVPVATFTIGTSGALSYVDWDSSGLMLANKQNHRVIDVWGAQRASGLLLSTSASHITITSGAGYLGVKQLTFTSASTQNINQFVLLSHSASVWSGSFLNGWINDKCDDGTNLQTLDTSKFVVNYVWRGIGSQNRSQVILSPQYNTYADAVESIMPAPPAELGNIAILTGRIIAKEGNATAQLVESAFTTIFSVAGVTNHNNLNGLLGGNYPEYYHLTANEYGNIASGSFVRISGSVITGSISNAITASYASDTPASISSSHAVQSDSASYIVPGATLYVVSGSNGVQSSYIEPYNYSPTGSEYYPPFKDGRMFYDNKHSDWCFYPDHDFRVHIGKEVIWQCYNATAATILKGTPVYISSSSDTVPNIYPAIADGTNRYSDVVGLIRHDIPSLEHGWVIQNGIMETINMTGFIAGDPVFLSTTLGELTNTEPSQPYESVRVGNCQVGGANGTIIISPVFKLPPVIAYAGMTTTPTITSDGSGSVIVSTGSVNLYNNPLGYGGVLGYPLLAQTLSLVTGSTNYIVAEISASAPTYTLTTSPSYANGISIVRVATLDIYTGDPPGTQWDVHQFKIGIVGLALANRLNNKDIRLYGYQRESGLTLYTTGSSGSFGITEGNIWYGPNSHIIPTFDTTLPGYYTYIFHTSGSGWHQDTSSIYLNGYYDDGTGGENLTTCAPLSWSVNYVYRLIGTTDESAIVMSSAQFATQLEASNNATTPPNLPSTIRDIGLLVGRFIVQSGSYATTVIESAFSNIFIPATVTDHESLLGLQGSTIGTGGGHYHLTSQDYTGTGTGIVVRSDGASLTNATITGSITTASHAAHATSASHALNANNAYAISFIPLTATSASWVSASVTINSASYAISASWAPDVTVTVESSSWASASISSSHALNADNAYAISFVPLTSTSASWVSSSIYIEQATFATQSVYSTQSLFSTQSIFATSASWASASISASHAITSSYALGIPTIKAGLISGSTFLGNPRTSSVSFGTPFVSNLYAVTITGEASRTWTIQGKSASGFTINSNNVSLPTGMVFWNAIYQGEYYS